MATSITLAGTNYNLATAAGAHACLIALDAHLIKVGLSRATTGTDYNLAGADTQMPTTVLATSAWIAYDFTDAAQSMYPITVWFRMVWGYTVSTNAASLRYVLQSRISEGQTAGTPLGANLEIYTGIGATATSTAYATTYSGSMGDFIRYADDSLTILFGTGSITVGYNSHNVSVCELHIERRYSATTGLVGRGFTGYVPPNDPAVASPTHYINGGYSMLSTTNPTVRPTPYVSSNDSANIFYIDGQTRPSASVLLVANGAAVVAPVYFMDPVHQPVPAMRLFTVPLSSFSQTTVSYLNFTGVEKPYLIYRPYSTSLKASVYAFAIEWE